METVAKKLHLTLSCGDYEITRPLIDGIVSPEGVELTILSSSSSRDRQWRLARSAECDISELNACAYFMARARGHPYVALPIFPHRRFRHGFIFVNTNKGILKPSDLIGLNVGVESGFQPAAAVWLRGILADEYGISHRDISWITDRDEDIPFTPQHGLHIERVETGSLDRRLAAGQLDALIAPGYPASFLAGDRNVGRLFKNFKEEEERYYRKTGIFPIMHVVVIREGLVQKHPWIASNIAFAFNEAKRLAYERVKNPRVVPLVWFSNAWEEQNAFFGHDPWEYGLGERNKLNLRTLIRYSYEQGLISEQPAETAVVLNVSEEALKGTSGF
jgi:4,5-dihydroxyphthalate decarboxylase